MRAGAAIEKGAKRKQRCVVLAAAAAEAAAAAAGNGGNSCAGSASPHGQEALAAITGTRTVQGNHPGSAASEPPQEVVQPVVRHPDCFYGACRMYRNRGSVIHCSANSMQTPAWPCWHRRASRSQCRVIWTLSSTCAALWRSQVRPLLFPRGLHISKGTKAAEVLILAPSREESFP